MIRWSMLMILSIASICCLAATTADDKEKAADTAATKAEKKNSKETKSESNKEDKFTAKCPISGEAAKKEQFASYKEKEVYFCCEKCKAAFEAEPTKFEVKANHQLVQTKQFVQKKCPISGAAVNKEEFARVSNVKVSFCCEKCKGAVQSVEADQKLEMIFTEKVFKTAFAAAKVKSEDGDDTQKPKASKEKKVTEKKATEKKADKPKED
ncbi:MAG: hypothetical protein O2856_02560 [Planctomycetota bacterium]|nr:hypothetical protein [Planctomycetota bacterium]